MGFRCSIKATRLVVVGFPSNIATKRFGATNCVVRSKKVLRSSCRAGTDVRRKFDQSGGPGRKFVERLFLVVWSSVDYCMVGCSRVIIEVYGDPTGRSLVEHLEACEGILTEDDREMDMTRCSTKVRPSRPENHTNTNSSSSAIQDIRWNFDSSSRLAEANLKSYSTTMQRSFSPVYHSCSWLQHALPPLPRYANVPLTVVVIVVHNRKVYYRAPDKGYTVQGHFALLSPPGFGTRGTVT